MSTLRHLLLLLLTLWPLCPAQASETSAQQALNLLKTGHQRYLSGQSQHPHLDAAHRKALAEQGQTPFAAVLGCADSRVPVELLFDAGPGDVFTVRTAGNTAHQTAISGSLEYAIEHLHVPLLLVLGHTECGAVKAVLANPPVEEPLASMLTPIQETLANVRTQDPHADQRGNLLEKTIAANTFRSIEDLLHSSPALRHAAQHEGLRIEAALYDLHTGQIRWLGQHPQQEALIEAASRLHAQAPPPPPPPMTFAIVVHGDNPVEELSSAHVELLFAGDTSNWIPISGERLPALLYGPAAQTDAALVFRACALQGRALPPEYQGQASAESVLEQVAKDPGAIAFVPYPYPRRPGVRALPIDGKVPTAPDYPFRTTRQ